MYLTDYYLYVTSQIALRLLLKKNSFNYMQSVLIKGAGIDYS